MASEIKKNKEKNSCLHNGAEKYDYKLKRIVVFAKRKRNKNKYLDFNWPHKSDFKPVFFIDR